MGDVLVSCNTKLPLWNAVVKDAPDGTKDPC